MVIEAIPITTPAQVRRMADLKISPHIIAMLINWPIDDVRKAIARG